MDSQDQNKPFSFKVWAKMIPFLKPYKGRMLIVISFMLLGAAIDVIYPLFQAYAVDHFIVPKSLDGLMPFILIFGLLLLIQTSGTILFIRQAMKIELNFGRDLKRSVFVHLQKLSFSFCQKACKCWPNTLGGDKA